MVIEMCVILVSIYLKKIKAVCLLRCVRCGVLLRVFHLDPNFFPFNLDRLAYDIFLFVSQSLTLSLSLNIHIQTNKQINSL